MKRTAFVTSLIFGGLSIVAAPAMAQTQGSFSFTQFSATTSTVMKAGTVTSKIARSGNKMRIEMPGSKGARYMILLLDQQKAYMIMAPGMCMEMPQLGPMASNPLAGSPQDKVDVKVLGTATVNGHAAQIEQVTIAPASGGKTVTLKVWAATDLHGFPVRTEMQSPQGVITTDYTGISLSAPADSLFAVPQNCRQMPAMPSGNMPQ